LLAAHGFGLILKPEDVFNSGIQNVTPFDINYAQEKNLRIKLIARIEKSSICDNSAIETHGETNGHDLFGVFVLPQFVPKNSSLGNVNYESNGIEVEGVFSDKQFFSGKGAGSHPTGSAVLSDISAITYDYKYGYKKLKKRINGKIPDYSMDYKFIERDFLIKLYIRYNNKSELQKLEIDSVEEQYSSLQNSYIIANVRFSSLKNLEESNKLFLCVV